MLSTTFLLSKTPFIKIFPPSAAHAFNYIPFIKHIPFIKISPPLCSPCFQLQRSFYQTHSFYQNFPPPLQPMLSTTFLLSKTVLLSKFSPPLQPMLSMIHVTSGHLRPYLTSFYPNFPPLCSPCFQLHSFYQKHSFYQNFSPPLQPMLSTTTFLLSNTFLLSKFPPPFAAHAFNYIPFIKNIPFIKIFPPSAAQAFNDSGYQVSSATLPDFL